MISDPNSLGGHLSNGGRILIAIGLVAIGMPALPALIIGGIAAGAIGGVVGSWIGGTDPWIGGLIGGIFGGVAGGATFRYLVPGKLPFPHVPYGPGTPLLNPPFLIK